MKSKLFLTRCAILALILVTMSNFALTRPVRAQEEQKTSLALIQKALADGKIDIGTSLVYRAYAGFNDDRLPAEYRSSVGVGANGSLALDIAANFDKLSDDAKQMLQPFLLPPFHAGSWWALRHEPATTEGSETPYTVGGRGAPPASALSITGPSPGCEAGNDIPLFSDWEFIKTEKVKIWWEKDHPTYKAAAELVAAEVPKVWSKLRDLLGREPPSDNGSSSWCRGEDDLLDISIVDMAPPAYTMRHGVDLPWRCQESSSFIILSGQELADGTYGETVRIRASLSHEMMHAFQNAFKYKDACDNYEWFRESVAQWAEDYIYPSKGDKSADDYIANVEQTWLSTYLDSMDIPLDVEHAPDGKDDEGKRKYASYIFSFFVSHNYDYRVIGSMFLDFANASVLNGINANLPDGFRAVWPKFALQTLNTHLPLPYAKYLDWDNIIQKPRMANATEAHDYASPSGIKTYIYKIDGNIPYLSARYYKFDFTKPATARYISFINPASVSPNPDASIQAVIKIQGQDWRTEDWTDETAKSFCKDVADERIETLYLIISNSSFDRSSPPLGDKYGQLTLATSNMGCWRWQGDSSFVVGNATPVAGAAEAQGVVFERVKDRDYDLGLLKFNVVGGTGAEQHRPRTEYECTGPAGTRTGLPLKGGLALMLLVPPDVAQPAPDSPPAEGSDGGDSDGTPDLPIVAGGGDLGPPFKVHYNCYPAHVDVEVETPNIWFFPSPMAPSGTDHLDYEDPPSTDGDGPRISFHFSAVSQP